MKICITSCGKKLESNVESHFGRSPYFIIWDTDNNEFEALENPNITETSGVGIQSAQLILRKGVKAILTGQVGPKALAVLEAEKIKIITITTGTVKEAIEKYKENDLAIKSTTTLGNRCGNRKKGRGRGLGAPAYCICPNCGEKITHESGVPCNSQICSKCHSAMIRG